MGAALVLLLALSPGVHAPDLQVEAGTTAGAELPQLAEAVARVLVASGARVVLGGPANQPCARCARVAITDLGQGSCRIDVTQDAHVASVILPLGANVSLFDRARAIAIQARLLVRVEPVARSSETQGQLAMRKKALKSAPDNPNVETPAKPPLALVDSQGTDASPREKMASSNPFPASQPDPRIETPAGLTSKSVPQPPPALVEQPLGPRPREPAPVEKRKPMAPEPTLAAHRAETSPALPRWPWIPFTVGVGSAVGAVLCGLAAYERYDGLSDKSRSYSQATLLKQEGEDWQRAAFVASGVAIAGLGIGIWGFATREPGGKSLTPTVAVVPGGAILAMTGILP